MASTPKAEEPTWQTSSAVQAKGVAARREGFGRELMCCANCTVSKLARVSSLADKTTPSLPGCRENVENATAE